MNSNISSHNFRRKNIFSSCILRIQMFSYWQTYWTDAPTWLCQHIQSGEFSENFLFPFLQKLLMDRWNWWTWNFSWLKTFSKESIYLENLRSNIEVCLLLQTGIFSMIERGCLDQAIQNNYQSEASWWERSLSLLTFYPSCITHASDPFRIFRITQLICDSQIILLLIQVARFNQSYIVLSGLPARCTCFW